MKNLAASREVSNPNPVKSFAASGGEFDPKGLKGSVGAASPEESRVTFLNVFFYPPKNTLLRAKSSPLSAPLLVASMRCRGPIRIA